MKHYKKILLGILCLFVGVAATSAQQNAFFIANANKNTEQPKRFQQNIYEISETAYYRHHKKLSLTHSGIVLELIVSDLPLKRDYPLFQQFGNIYYDQLEKGGYAYCILTNFDDMKKAKKYLEQVVLPRAPKAKVVKYQMGRRKKEV